MVKHPRFKRLNDQRFHWVVTSSLVADHIRPSDAGTKKNSEKSLIKPRLT